jgi:hypothetical protein
MQLKLSERELGRLADRISEDFDGAVADHNRRMERFRRYYQRWRARIDPPAQGEEDRSNFSVPLLQWQVYAKWASDLAALFGDDAEVIARPVGPSDNKTAKKVGMYMTWRVFQSMSLIPKFSPFEFRKTLFGRAHAYCPWVRDTYKVKEKGKVREEVWYEGPGFEACWPDDIIVPAEDADSIQDFSFVIRKYRVTPQQLLDGEREGRYFGIKDSIDQIVSTAQDKRQRDWKGSDPIKSEKDLAEGVTQEGSQATRDSIIVHEWYGRWRLPKGKADARLENMSRRNLDESEIVVRYLPDLKQVVAVQDLMDLYPHMRNRRPFLESNLVKDGSYWSPGFGEMLESIEDEASVNHNLFTEAGQLSVGPVIFYRPGSGFDPEKFRYEPGMAYPCDDPAAIKVVEMNADLQYPVIKEQSIYAMGERLTGQSDQTLGRAIDRPNAPRTARGQIALIEQGNVRASLDTMSLREDMRAMMLHFWLLDSYFSPESVFFRVTEDDAEGIFDVKDGFGEMTPKERGGRYDFDIQLATSVHSREAEKDRVLTLYQLDLTNPLIVTNPKALYVTTAKLHKAMGDEDFASVIPEPPDLDRPKTPKEEWNLCLQGEDFDPNPMDNDEFHLIDHYRRLEKALDDPESDMDAIKRMQHHVLAQQMQKRQKMLMQAMVAQLAEQVSQNPQASAMVSQLAGNPALSPMQEEQEGGGQPGQPGQPQQPGAPGGGMPQPMPSPMTQEPGGAIG